MHCVAALAESPIRLLRCLRLLCRLLWLQFLLFEGDFASSCFLFSSSISLIRYMKRLLLLSPSTGVLLTVGNAAAAALSTCELSLLLSSVGARLCYCNFSCFISLSCCSGCCFTCTAAAAAAAASKPLSLSLCYSTSCSLSVQQQQQQQLLHLSVQQQQQHSCFMSLCSSSRCFFYVIA